MIVNVTIDRIAVGPTGASEIGALRAAVAAAVEHRVAIATATSGTTLPTSIARVSQAVAAEVAARCS